MAYRIEGALRSNRVPNIIGKRLSEAELREHVEYWRKMRNAIENAKKFKGQPMTRHYCGEWQEDKCEKNTT